MDKFRFKVVRTDGSHYFTTHKFLLFSGAFIHAASVSQTADDVRSVDIYYCKTNKLIATFYH